MTGSPRQLLPGLLPNLRDCGGMRTADGKILRHRLLLRSAALVGLSPTTVTAFTAAVCTGAYVDLRTDAEIARDGAPRELVEVGWLWHRMPINDGSTADGPADEIVRRCLRSVPKYLDAAYEIASLLGPRPLVVGCAVGKDRTGLITAIVLQWLGIRRAEILEDFTESNACLRSGRRLLPPRWQNPDHVIGTADAAVCAAVLDEVSASAPPPGDVRVSRPFTGPLSPTHDSDASSDAFVAAVARRR